MLRIRPTASASLSTLCLLSLLFAPAIVGAGDSKKPAAKPAAKSASVDAMATPAGVAALGLPQYTPPPSFSVDLVIKTEGHDMTMKRYIDNGKIRTELDTEGQQMVMIEMGDEPGTTYMLMPEQKMAMKQSRAAMEEAMKKMNKKGLDEAQAKGEAAAAEVKLEAAGEETIDGRAAKKIRMVTPEGTVFGWFDKESGAPMRFESTAEGKKSTIEWKNFKPGPQPAALYEVPKGYEVRDMDEMTKQMGSMGGMGMAGTMAGGMATGYAQSMGSSMGSSLGGALGASLGGPLGMVAGQYIGGKLGGMIGHKAADMVIPGKQ
jgi:outer membrane lipoprotein-sorting protein